MLILMLTRRYPEALAKLKVGEMYGPLGLELVGRKLLIVGFGASGIELARRALPFGFQISAIDIRAISPDEVKQFDLHATGQPADLDRLLAEVDIVSLHLHLNPETRHTMDARRLALMKPTAFLINVARGALVDEAALAEALRERRIAGAGLDVYVDEPHVPSALTTLPNVTLLPHIGSATLETRTAMGMLAVDNLVAHFAGQPMPSRVV
jgi:glyoxylate reductase